MALQRLFRAITTTTRQTEGTLNGQLIDEGEMHIPWYNEFMNLVQITMRYFNDHAWVLERFKQIVFNFMDNFYNTIDANNAAQVPPQPPVARDPHFVINFLIPPTPPVVPDQGYPANAITTVAKHYPAGDPRNPYLIANPEPPSLSHKEFITKYIDAQHQTHTVYEGILAKRRCCGI